MDIQFDHLYDRDQLATLFSKLLAGDFASSYIPSYSVWSAQTLDDLNLGRKVAIGAWLIPDRQRGTKGDLIGCCILKRIDSLHGAELELEVIHVNPKYRNPHYYPDTFSDFQDETRQLVGARLLQKTEELCQKYGYRRIVAEVPTKFSKLVFFLLRRHFVVQGYDGHEQQYRLTKHVELIYNKDPYDVNMIVRWLCSKWGIEIREWPQKDHAIGCYTIGQETKWEAEIDILVCDNLNSLRHKAGALRKTSRLVFLKNEETLTSHDINGPQTYYVQPSIVKTETQNQDIDLTLQDYAAAAVVSIRKEFFGRFKTGERQVFLDGGEYGNILLNRIQSELNRHAFIVFSNTSVNHQEMLGVGKVISVHMGSPDELWSEFGHMTTFAHKSDFDRYRNIKTSMTAIVFEGLEVNSERADFKQKLERRGWSYLTDEEFYKEVLARSKYPQTLRLVKG